MSALRFLIIKEFKQIFRNRGILPVIFAAPIIQLIILPLAADYEIKNINISIVDNDRSQSSSLLISRIQASAYFRIVDMATDYNHAFQQMESDQTDLILEIPAAFEENLHRESKQDLFLAVNAINGTKAIVGSAYLGKIIAGFNQVIRQRASNKNQVNPYPVIEIATLNWYNPLLNYPAFMVPGILVLLVTMVGVYLCALNIVKEKEKGTIEQINVSPIRKHHFILGKLIPFWLIGVFVYSAGLFLVARGIYGIVPAGNILLLYAFLSIYLIAVLGIGLLISTHSNTQQQAMSIAFFFMMIFILMSGLFTSIDSMPVWAQWIARCNPAAYFIEVNRMVMMKGSGFYDIRMHFLITAGFAIVFNTWAISHYKKTS